MKVLFLNVVFRWGSTGRIISDICEKLEESGHTGIAIYGRGQDCPGQSWPGHYRVASRFSVFWHVLLTRITDLHGRFSSASTRKIIKIIQREQPDIIHLHNIHGYWLNYPLLFKYLQTTDIPLMWTLHDCWAFTGHCSHFDFANCQKWKQVCGKCPEKKQYPASYLWDASKNNLKLKKLLFSQIHKLTVVCPSNWLASLAKESFLGRYPVQVINNGIDTSIFNPDAAKGSEKALTTTQNKAFIVLGVASIWNERKGLSFMISLAERLPDDCQVCIVGRLDSQPKTPKNLTYIERTSSIQEMATLYATADVFVNPTLEDTFPTTNLEAQACGTPVITFASGGSPESVPSECGIVVPRADLQALVDAVVLIRQRGKAAYSEACIKNALTKYPKHATYFSYIQLYEEIAKELTDVQE